MPRQGKEQPKRREVTPGNFKWYWGDGTELTPQETKDFNTPSSSDQFWGALGQSLGIAPQRVTGAEPGADLDTAGADAQRGQLEGLMAELQQQASTGHGAWENTLRAATQRSTNAAQSIGQSDANVDYGSALDNIGNAQAGAVARSTGQGDRLRTESKLDAQGQLADLTGSMGSGDVEQANAVARARQQAAASNLALVDQSQQQGANLRNGISQAASFFSDGGRVPGDAVFGGDDPRNDTIAALLSPEEIVVPRSAAKDPDRAAAFARAIAKQNGPQSFADGGSYNAVHDYGEGNVALSLLLPAIGQQVGYSNLRGKAGAGDPSVQNGGALDTTNFDKTRAARGATSSMFTERAAGNGPSVADSDIQRGGDDAIAAAMRAQQHGAPAASVVSGATEMTQGAGGQAAATRASEQAAGQRGLGRVATQGRAQELSLAEAQQQAAWQNTMSNLGISLANQAALRGMFSGAGQAVTAASGMHNSDRAWDESVPDFKDTSGQTNDLGFQGGDEAWNESTPDSPDTSGQTNDLGGFAYGGAVGYADGGRVEGRYPAMPSPKNPGHVEVKVGDVQLQPTPETRAQRKAAEYEEETGDAPSARHAKKEPSERNKLADFAQSLGAALPHFAEGGGVADAGAGYQSFDPYSFPERRDSGPVVYVSDSPVPGTQPVQLGGAGGGAPDMGAGGAGGAGGASGAMQADRGSGGATGGPSDSQIPQHEAIQPRAERPPAQPALPPGVTPKGEAAPPAPAPAALPAKPAPGGGGGIPLPKTTDRTDLNAQNEAAINATADLEAQKARAEATGAAERQRVASEYALKEKDVHDRARVFTDDAFTRLRAAQDEMNRIDARVDSGRFWSSRTMPQKILGIIGLALGAAGTGPDGINRSAQMMNQAIDRDIEAQKAEFEARLRKGGQKVAAAQSFYSMAREAGLDEVAATHAAKAAALEQAAAKTEAAVAGINEPMAKAKGQALIVAARGGAADKTDAAKQRTFENQIQRGALAAQQEAASRKGGLSEGERKSVGDVTAAARDAMGLINSIEGTLSRTQSAIPGKTAINQHIGGDAAQLDTDTAQLVVKMKDINKLGQLGPADSKLLEEAIGDPKAIFTLESTKRAKLDRIKQIIRDSVANERAARGLQ
jgi:hypothetical protein